MTPLAVSMGDPAGVGLEIAARAWAEQREHLPPFFVVGDAYALERAAARCGLVAPVAQMESASAVEPIFARALPVLHRQLTAEETPGLPSPQNAQVVIDAIDTAVAQVRSGKASALITLPIAKAVLYAAGFAHPGHTEYIAHLTADMPQAGPRGPVMMLATEGLRVALATIHAPLAEVSSLLTRERLMQTARVTLHALSRDFGIESPRLAIAGLNPHAGEGGAIGREDVDVIAPVVAALKAEGHAVSGPHPADTLFHAEARARHDAVIATYHDQGLIPIKTLDFWGAVNITLGLPIVRTSPDHGTGFDIAGRGLARADSFIAALKVAAAMAARRT